MHHDAVARLSGADMVAVTMDVLVPSKVERRAEGQSRRKRMGRSEHGDWKRKKGARNALEVLREASADRVPHLLKLKYERMAASPFGYLRGGCAGDGV